MLGLTVHQLFNIYVNVILTIFEGHKFDSLHVLFLQTRKRGGTLIEWHTLRIDFRKLFHESM